MLALSPLSKLPLADAMGSQGGFFWWYIDGVDASGDGFVLVASFGLPFLPGSRRASAARNRPTLNLVVYRGGVPEFYLLQTYDREDGEFDDASGRMTIGDTSLTITRDGDRYCLRVDLDAVAAANGGRVTGTIRSEGRLCRLAEQTPGAVDVRHCWEPIAIGQSGDVSLELDSRPLLRQRVRLYVDSNASTVGLHELGIDCWRWGRVAFPSREQVYYEVVPSRREANNVALAVCATPDGPAELNHNPRFSWGSPDRNKYGVSYDRELAFGETVVTMSTVVDEGPFYLRFLVEAYDHQTGESGRGFAEVVRPKMIDRFWHRPFVSMRHHEVGKENSVWLPLFSGPRTGRTARLAASFRMRAERQLQSLQPARSLSSRSPSQGGEWTP